MTDQTAATECAFADEGCTCGRPRLTLTEAQARMAAAPQPGPTFATYLDRTERDQLDARAACADQERDDALDDRDTTRAEAANLRRELDKANAGRQKLQSELDTMTHVAQGNKRHVAYLTAVIEAIANVEPHIHNGDTTEDNCSPYCPGCRIRTAMNTTIDGSKAGLGSAPPRAQDDEATPRRLLDQAIESALPQAGGNVRALLKALRRELKRVDVKRAEHAEREG